MTAIQYIIIIACLLLAAWLVLKEIQRPDKGRLVLRIIASVLALASLVFLAIPVQFKATEISGEQEAILLTGGYDKDSVDAFLKQHKNTVVYTKDAYELQPVGDNKLHVFGYGLSADEWQNLAASNIVFHPSVISTGITNIGYDQQINSGDVLVVQGRFNNITGKKIKLALSGFGIEFDSVVIDPGRSQIFELTTIPKFIGRAVYNITAIAGKDTIEQEQLPIEVVSTQPLKILLLAAFPDFENKFLQNWLSENNYVVASRTTISRNKYSYSYLDTARFSLAQITPGVLEQFDVLIADAAALSSLSKQELFNINNQINDKGLGLIIKADSTGKPAVFYNHNCSVAPSPDHNKQTLTLQLQGNDTVSTLPVGNALFIKVNDGAKNLITDTKKNVLACDVVYGNGSIVFSTFRNSYYWMLSGDKKSYHALWSSLITTAARKAKVDQQWSISPAFPVINHPIELTAETLSEQALRPVIENNVIAFAAQPYLPFEWKGIYWPGKKGWQPVVSSKGDAFWLYVFDKNDWKNMHALQKINETYAYATTNKKLAHDDTVTKSLNKKPVPAFYFFIVFCCCCIFLWIEKKM